jgi:hypothetical protein
MKAKTGKQVLKAMLWMYENGLGWTQNFSYKDSKGSYYMREDLFKNGLKSGSACLSGCIGLTECEGTARVQACKLLNQALGLPTHNMYNNFVGWNDCSNTTKEKVLEALRKAIKS